MNDDSSQWTEADDARLQLHALDQGHPSRVLKAFNDLFYETPFPISELETFVTPEARSDWGDFAGARTFFLDQALGLSTRALRARGAVDVAYVKIVPEREQAIFSAPREDVLGFATFVWRPEIGGWKIHALGPPIPAERLPRTASDAPSYETDTEVQVVTE